MESNAVRSATRVGEDVRPVQSSYAADTKFQFATINLHPALRGESYREVNLAQGFVMAEALRYRSDAETVAPDEAATQVAITNLMREIVETTSRDYGHAGRSVHAKSYALLEGELTIPDNLPTALAQGIFNMPAKFPVVLRFSTNPGDILDDAVSTPRGLAIKVIGVDGERLPDSEGAVTQDFVLATGPAFAAPDPKAFVANLKLLAATTDRAEIAKKALSAALRSVGAGLKAMGHESSIMTDMGGKPLTHPLGESFYSQVPLRHGDYVAKLMIAPVSAELVALIDQPLELHGNPNALRQAAIETLAVHGGEWEVRIQLWTDAATMPIEDASVEWPEAQSPYVPVARIRVESQPAWNEARAVRGDDGLSFTPWHGLLAHQPLGSINRARRPAYPAIVQFRSAFNGVRVAEPSAAIEFSDAPANAVGKKPGREGFRNALPTNSGAKLSPVAAGAAGGLAAGLIVSALMLAKGATSGKVDDLVQLERKLSHRAPNPMRTATAPEHAASQVGHLLLSVAAGASYGMLKPRDIAAVPAGLALGIGFLALTYGGAGPAFGLVPPPWRETVANNLQHILVHALFGVTIALVTERLMDRK